MLNYIRLSTDADPTGTLHRLVDQHPRYQEFLPTLRYVGRGPCWWSFSEHTYHAVFFRADTLAQIKFNYNWKLDSCPRPPVHIGPSPPIRLPPYSTYTPTLQLTGGTDTDESNGIDLGSDCKYHSMKEKMYTSDDLPYCVLLSIQMHIVWDLIKPLDRRTATKHLWEIYRDEHHSTHCHHAKAFLRWIPTSTTTAAIAIRTATTMDLPIWCGAKVWQLTNRKTLKRRKRRRRRRYSLAIDQIT